MASHLNVLDRYTRDDVYQLAWKNCYNEVVAKLKENMLAVVYISQRVVDIFFENISPQRAMLLQDRYGKDNVIRKAYLCDSITLSNHTDCEAHSLIGYKTISPETFIEVERLMRSQRNRWARAKLSPKYNDYNDDHFLITSLGSLAMSVADPTADPDGWFRKSYPIW